MGRGKGRYIMIIILGEVNGHSINSLISSCFEKGNQMWLLLYYMGRGRTRHSSDRQFTGRIWGFFLFKGGRKEERAQDTADK